MRIDTASAVGGCIGRGIGRFVKASKIARHNLSLCFPNMSEDEKNKIIKGMWDNLGRMVGELPHIAELNDEQVSKRIDFKTMPKNLPKCGLFLSAHFGNFELPIKIIELLGIKISIVHRPANNPYVNKLINKHRLKEGITMLTKGKTGVKRMLEIAKEKSALIGMLVDQKTNTGIDVPFFGMPAKTTPFPANLAIRYNLPIFLVCPKRKKGAYFEFSVEQLKLPKDATAKDIMTIINAEFEKWIRENPEQWFWVHRRWGKI